MASPKSQINKERLRVDVDYSDITIRELHRMLTSNELNAAPSYQRKFRWSEKAESRLIESLFLGLPVPSIFVATNHDFSWEVVDGLQRLSSIAHFIGKPKSFLKSLDKESPLILTDLEKLTQLNGKQFSDLDSELQLLFNRRTLRVTALSDKSDLKVRFDLFERLNSGAVALTPQEVRSCIYRGKFNDFLEELAGTKNYQACLKLKSSNKNDGTAEELVLKFFAYLTDRESFKGSVIGFLNNFMERSTKRFNYRKLRPVFEAATQHLHDCTDGQPFLRKNVTVTPINQLEGVLVGIAEGITEGKELVIPANGWQNDPALVKASTGGTNSKSSINKRIERSKELLTK